jgi:hypothetical protein
VDFISVKKETERMAQEGKCSGDVSEDYTDKSRGIVLASAEFHDHFL